MKPSVPSEANAISAVQGGKRRYSGHKRFKGVERPGFMLSAAHYEYTDLFKDN